MAADEETTNEDATSSKLGARPAHALRSAFGAVDANLREIESAVRTTSTSVFASDEDDLTHEDRTIVLEYVRRVRASMVAALATSGIRPRSRKRSLRDSLRTIVTFALIGVDEASPTKLRGYGELGSDDEARLETSLSELRRSLGELQQWLERPPSDALRGRIESLTDVPVDVDHLLALEQAIVTHGMVDLRGPLRALVEALEARVFEIAVVGLVSCGKSTFLNALLETNVLPVGAEPVTSVPTRIVHGETPELVVLHANGRNERSTLEHVGDFVTEAGNPDNRKNVLRVTLRLPSRRLERHVALVDTPGLGPLARAGERSTYAYLPRCDSAVHLIDGTVGPRPADVEMARALRLSGIAVQTLLSKADLVPAAEREAVEAPPERGD